MANAPNKARILHLDIENMFIKAAVWGLWKQNVGINGITADWYVLCYAAKWDGEEDIYYDHLTRYKSAYKENRENDYHVLLTLRDLLDEADIVVAHNGKAFDIKKIQARFLKHGIPPASPFRMVDTLLVARSQFALTSNKLDYLARILGLGKKLDTGGLDLWVDCDNGDLAAWQKMIDYNIQDVVLLEKVYHKLLPWISNHPNLALYTLATDPVCPKCGSSSLQWRGYAYTNVSVFRRFQCNDCGGWGRDRVNTLTKEQRKGVMANATSNN